MDEFTGWQGKEVARYDASILHWELRGRGDTGSETGPTFCNKEVLNKPTDMPLVQLCAPSACTVYVCVCALPIRMYAQMD